MSEQIDKFCNDLRESLMRVETRVDKLKSNLASARGETQAAVKAKLDKAKTAIETHEQEARAAKERLEQRIEDKKAETSATIAEWKANRELGKLERRAERKERYAADAIVMAAYAADDAEYAMLEAIEARLLADEAAGAGQS